MNDYEKKQIFEEELYEMNKKSFISNDDYSKIKKSYFQYYQHKTLKTSNVSEKLTSNVCNDRIEFKPETKKALPPPIPQRKVLSPKEIKDRNTSLILIIGVVFILLSGLILATSNWDVISNTSKTLMLSLTTLLFFGISWVSENKLKIEKTSYAFWTLGSLSIPIIILSAGFFGLFGDWLSLYGEGRYTLGIIGGAVYLPVCLYSINKYKNSFFKWVSLLTTEFIWICILKMFNFQSDVFFFGLISYNCLLIVVENKFKKHEKFSIILKDFTEFIQFNIVFNSFLVTLMFNNGVIHGINLLLVAVLYLYLLLSKSDSKRFDTIAYVFTFMILNGVYSLVESSPMSNIDSIIFAMIWILFAVIEKTFIKIEYQKGLFNNIIGFIGFISVINLIPEIFNITSRYSGFVTLTTCILISINYIYVSNKINNDLFNFMSSISLLVSGCELILLLDFNKFCKVELIIFMSSIALFEICYHNNKFKYLQNIKKSSMNVAILGILESILSSIILGNIALSSLFLLVFTYVLFTIFKLSNNVCLRNKVKYIIPTVFLFGLINTFDVFSSESATLEHLVVYISVCSLILYGISFLIRKFEENISKSTFYVSNISITSSLILWLVIQMLGKSSIVDIIIIAIMGGTLVYSCLIEENEKIKRIFTFIAVFSMTVLINEILLIFNRQVYDLYLNLGISTLFMISTVITAIVWIVLSSERKDRVIIPLMLLSALGLLANKTGIDYGAVNFIIALCIIFIQLYLLRHYKVDTLAIIPLFFLLNDIFLLNLDSNILFWILLVFAIVLMTLGQLISDKLFKNIDNKFYKNYFFIDWYTAFSLFFLIIGFIISLDSLGLIEQLISATLIAGHCYMQKDRLSNETSNKIVESIAMTSILIPCYVMLYHIEQFEPIYLPLYTNLLPIVVLSEVITKKIWSETNYVKKAESITLGLLIGVYGLLFIQVTSIPELSNILLFGTLSLITMLYGYTTKIKKYFLVGAGALLLNTLFQTRGLWSNIPWWGYLLITGLVLIITASINEMNKNKKDKFDKEKIKNIFKDWK